MSLMPLHHNNAPPGCAVYDLQGWVLMANALPELPAFFFFGRILSTLGMNTVLLAAAGTLGLRIWAYSVGEGWGGEANGESSVESCGEVSGESSG